MAFIKWWRFIGSKFVLFKINGKCWVGSRVQQLGGWGRRTMCSTPVRPHGESMSQKSKPKAKQQRRMLTLTNPFRHLLDHCFTLLMCWGTQTDFSFFFLFTLHPNCSFLSPSFPSLLPPQINFSNTKSPSSWNKLNLVMACFYGSLNATFHLLIFWVEFLYVAYKVASEVGRRVLCV